MGASKSKRMKKKLEGPGSIKSDESMKKGKSEGPEGERQS